MIVTYLIDFAKGTSVPRSPLKILSDSSTDSGVLKNSTELLSIKGKLFYFTTSIKTTAPVTTFFNFATKTI